MLDDIGFLDAKPDAYRIVVITLDSHAAGPAERVQAKLSGVFPGLTMSIHAAAMWAENPELLVKAKAAIATADMILVNLIFLEEHISAILPDLKARRDQCDAVFSCISAGEMVALTRLGDLDMSQPTTGVLSLLKKLRGSSKSKNASGEKQMKMLRRLPKILKFIPGKAQDVRAYFLGMQYWLGGSDENIESLVRFMVNRYATRIKYAEVEAAAPIDYPDVGLYHPDHPERITTDAATLPEPDKVVGTVGLLVMRSYILSGDTAHYDGVIHALEARGLRVITAFASGLDARPAIEEYFETERGSKIDTLISLTGFCLVGGPAYQDSVAAQEVLSRLDIPYISAHALEFQTLGQWAKSGTGLGPVEATMLVALPEIDGATNPLIFGGRVDEAGCDGCHHRCRASAAPAAMIPCPERIERLAGRALSHVELRRSKIADRKVGVVIFGFPPNAGAVGSAAYLSVFESLHNTLHAMKAEGYSLTPPETVEGLREAVLKGNAERYGQEANVAARVPADRMVAEEKYLSEIEAAWGPAPGRQQSDGGGVFVLGAEFGNVFVGVQPGFGYEGDPMRLMFEKSFAPTHAFSTFYRWMREDFGADVLLHFGMHGALEFMPGKHSGLSEACWPDRLMADTPNVYLYAVNNPSEGTLAKRRAGAVMISHLTPPLSKSGLYKGLLDLKDTLQQWRSMAPGAEEESELLALIADQAEAVDLDYDGDPKTLWLVLLETESALIPDGMHVVGAPVAVEKRAAYRDAMIEAEASEEAIERAEASFDDDTELPAIMHALSGGFTPPAPGGDVIRSPEVLPTGRNLHAFDPFRMPTAFAMKDGARQAQRLIDRHETIPRSVALVLWGSDNIKSDGGPLAQALALMGARPRFDNYGRLCGADLVSLEELGRPRVDVVMTLSGIFRDLLPLQTKLLAEAAYICAHADEPLDQNFIRAHALEYAERMGVDLETAALRVFSNAEGAYGSNVNQLIDSGAWDEEEELADAYEKRKSFAYGRNGKCAQQGALLKAALADVELAYQNLESVELGVTTVDHYFDTLGGISRAVKRASGKEAAVYISDTTKGDGKIRTLKEQVALETRSRSLNPKWFEGMLKHGSEGVVQIDAQVKNTLGWSATTGEIDPWVYTRLSETFILDDDMRRRLADLNPAASSRVANRLLEAHERNYWNPDAETLEALRQGANELEDRLEGIGIAAE